MEPYPPDTVHESTCNPAMHFENGIKSWVADSCNYDLPGRINDPDKIAICKWRILI